MSNQQTGLNSATLKIVWGALTMTLFVYAFLLFTTKGVRPIPEQYTLLEQIALIYNFMIGVTFFIHQKMVKPQKDLQKRATFNIICWALNESVAVFAFVAVFTNPEGSIMLYAINASMALVGNFLTFPRD